MSTSQRKTYTVKSVITDLKKVNPTPKITYDIGNRLVYYQWNTCAQTLGNNHPITAQFYDLLDFMQNGYEAQLVQGEFWRASDTPSAALNGFLKERPKEFLDFEFERPHEYIRDLLKEAKMIRAQEIKEYKKIEKNLKKMVNAEPENANLWNEYRLVLWIIEKYNEASTAFQTARKLGWDTAQKSVVAL